LTVRERPASGPPRLGCRDRRVGPGPRRLRALGAEGAGAPGRVDGLHV